jgi:xanthine/CO dehydrogenase XdhC/CoxF family maturation factor
MSSLSEELVEINERGAAAVLATVVEADGIDGVEAGAKCLVRDGKVRVDTIGHGGVTQAIVRESEARLRAEKSQLVSLELPAAGGNLRFFSK